MVKKNKIIGYTTGVFDLFHIGHVRLLNNAKKYCDKLIVGISTDELVSYKNKRAVISQNERMEIVKNIKAVDEVVFQKNMNKFEMWKKLKFNVMFVGDDWKGTEKWNEFERIFSAVELKLNIFHTLKVLHQH